MLDKLEVAANKVVGNIPSSERDEFKSIITILMVISILISIARLIQACKKKGSDVPDLAKNLSLLERRRLKQHIKKHLKSVGGKFDNSLADAIIEYGKSTDVAELEVAFESAIKE